MISEVMAEEVNALCSPKLCGPKHRPNESDYTRAGSSPGRVLVDGGHEQVVRPRVHQTAQLAKPREVRLASYRAACDPEQLTGAMIQALASDVSTREVKNVKSNSPGVSKSNVSMHWQHVGQNFVN